MFRPMQQYYKGLSEAASVEDHDNSLLPYFPTLPNKSSSNSGLKTDLRLGLPGSESPDRNIGLKGPSKVSASGAKRASCDAVDGFGRWALSINGGGSEVDLCRDGRSFSGLDESGSLEVHSLRDMLNSSSYKPAGRLKKPQASAAGENSIAHDSMEQVVGWPPVRSFRRNKMASASARNDHEDDEAGTEETSGRGCCLYVKVSMDGAPYLRKVDLSTCRSYAELSSALGTMFSCFNIVVGNCVRNGRLAGYRGRRQTEICVSDYSNDSDYALTYEDKDGDWMLVGDVPWKMFTRTCRRLRIMKGSDAIGLVPRQPL